MKPKALHRAKARSSISFPAHIVDELRRYDEHLRDVRGLATETRKGRLYVVGLLLQGKFKARAIELGKLHPNDIRQFLAMQSGIRCSASHASHLVSHAIKDIESWEVTGGTSRRTIDWEPFI